MAAALVADGSGLGTEASPLVQGGMFEVNASANEEVPDTAILGIISSRDTALATTTLAIGKDLTLTLIRQWVTVTSPFRRVCENRRERNETCPAAPTRIR